MRSRELIVFDWDGTLMDSTARIVTAVQAAIATSGLPERAPGEIRSIIGLGLNEAVEVLYPDTADEARRRLARIYGETFVQTAARTPAELFPGALRVLQRLERAGRLLAVATGKSRAGLQRDLEQTGIGEYFVSLRTVDECPSKPDPAMLEDVMNECGVDADGTLVVGDTLFDLEMAANAGVDAVGVGWGAHSPERLLQARPLDVVHDFDELDRWFDTTGLLN
jgi:phosphoglycolate phosphatase